MSLKVTEKVATVSRRPTAAYSVAMVAERWGTSDTFVYDQIKTGKLPAFKLGAKLIRIRPEAVEGYEARAEAASQIEPIPTQAHPDPANNAASIARLMRRHPTT